MPARRPFMPVRPASTDAGAAPVSVATQRARLLLDPTSATGSGGVDGRITVRASRRRDPIGRQRAYRLGPRQLALRPSHHSRRNMRRGARLYTVGSSSRADRSGGDHVGRVVAHLHRVPTGGSVDLGHVGEAGELLEEGQPAHPCGPVAVLGHDDLGLAPVGRIGVVDIIPVDEHNHICVLLNAS